MTAQVTNRKKGGASDVEKTGSKKCPYATRKTQKCYQKSDLSNKICSKILFYKDLLQGIIMRHFVKNTCSLKKI
jgi:hypothetical protein